ncbi:MAG: hypothetical protein HRU19_09765 [Pseudobacteriovorax sp.]|nr:hypothetical protein [Pseudobacteriovorax sp.]
MRKPLMNLTQLLMIGILFCPSLLGKSGNFVRTINNGNYTDPYDPRTRPDQFVGKIQTGSHADYTTDTIETLEARYYLRQDFQFYLKIPELESEFLGIGAEYRMPGGIGDKTWFGLEFFPEDSDIGVYLRGVNKRSAYAKFHYRFDLIVFDEANAYQFSGGYQNHPFRSSKNTFIDFKGAYRLFKADNFDVSNLSLIAEIGHGWPTFADVRGLEIFGSIGIEYSSVSADLDDNISQESSDSDADIRLVIGVLYKNVG